MKRQQFLFRPNPHSDLHQRAWAYLQTCPTGQKNDYIAWAIIRLESQKEFENILREILKEPEAVPHESVRAHRSSAASTIPGEMLGGAATVMRNVSERDGLCRAFLIGDDKVNAEGYERILGQMSGREEQR